ncbi:hypothetical protein MATL_G00047280 [Megalops atlanticus]|uniref:Lysosomal-associated membrane protein 2 n=1 Tax=Megalops atlanticus TaxID=7932 RepID=A0A9D3Q9U2_MEGAT|nr:hypothetical protein MATL_G00047280 [Megalops atlanticus]
MRHYAFLALFLLLGSETVCANVTTVPTAAPTTVTTVPTPAPTTVTTVPTPAPTTITTVPTPAPTTVTTVPTPAPTTVTAAPTPAPTNATAPPTTAAANATTAPPPETTTEATNATTAPAPEPTTEVTNGTTVAPPEPTTEAANATTAPSPATTAAPTPAPTPLPQPSVGSYSVRNKENSTACLMATMGLQISYKEGTVLKSINLDPNNTAAAGSCGVNGSDASLLLTFDKGSIAFVFSEEGRKFRLHVVNATISPGANGTAFSASNTNLSLWEASVGTSYMCRKDQTYNITDALTLHTLGLQVQPFGVQNNSFSTAHECSMDDTSILIPIVVGAALAGLILIVMIAYVIGRRKTYVGYQTL